MNRGYGTGTQYGVAAGGYGFGWGKVYIDWHFENSDGNYTYNLEEHKSWERELTASSIPSYYMSSSMYPHALIR